MRSLVPSTNLARRSHRGICPARSVDEINTEPMQDKTPEDEIRKRTFAADLVLRITFLDQLTSDRINGLGCACRSLFQSGRRARRWELGGLHAQRDSKDELADGGAEAREEGIEGLLAHRLAWLDR
jgi:hypothetical protein